MIFVTKNFIPKEYHNSVFDIDYDKLYAEGFRLILFDIDNTLVCYHEIYPDNKVIELISSLKQKGFAIFLISNNFDKRVRIVAKNLELRFISFALKPFKRGFKRVIRITKQKRFVMIGDRLLTDINGGNRMHAYTILVKSLESNKKHFTKRFGTIFEDIKLRKLKKKNNEVYERLLKEYDNGN